MQAGPGHPPSLDVGGKGYKEKGRFRQPDRSPFPAFCHPVVAGGRLYLRDEDVLLCYDVKEQSSTPHAQE